MRTHKDKDIQLAMQRLRKVLHQDAAYEVTFVCGALALGDYPLDTSVEVLSAIVGVRMQYADAVNAVTGSVWGSVLQRFVAFHRRLDNERRWRAQRKKKKSGGPK